MVPIPRGTTNAPWLDEVPWDRPREVASWEKSPRKIQEIHGIYYLVMTNIAMENPL
jgi:hypothetical protein